MENLIQDIRAYCSAADISAATFGTYAANDGKFMARLERGQEIMPRTEKKVRAWMAANPPEQFRKRGAIDA